MCEDACIWQSARRRGCDRIDTFLCPTYMYVNGVFVYLGHEPLEIVTESYYCFLA